MKKIAVAVLSVCCIVATVSCDRIWEEKQKNDAYDNYTSPYIGTWIGAVDGVTNGKLTIMVSKNGYVNGTVEYEGHTDRIGGAVQDNGALQSMYSVDKAGFNFYGSLKDRRGTWKRNDKSGGWQVTKQ